MVLDRLPGGPGVTGGGRFELEGRDERGLVDTVLSVEWASSAAAGGWLGPLYDLRVVAASVRIDP